ncbi:MAG: PIN domain-containing protein [Coprothermobacterota bacterium]|nr:PIN domain-containing protein [Coprothermobacterota bacterium]
MYLLDTTHCIHLLNGDESVVGKMKQLGLALVCTCVIVRGELLFGALNSARASENFQNAKEFLKDIRVLELDEASADIYASLKAAVFRTLGPGNPTKRNKAKISDFGFSDHDLWIASVAIQNNAIVVSGDDGFQRLQAIEHFPLENW